MSFLSFLTVLLFAVTTHGTAPLAVPAKHTTLDKTWRLYPARTVETLGPLPAAPPTDAYGGRADRWGAVTGFFHVQKIGDRWWLIDPDGRPFLHVGVNSVSPGAAPDRAAWAAQATALLRDNGFNGVGAWSATPTLRGVAAPPAYTLVGHSGTPGGGAGGFLAAFGAQRRITRQGAGHADYPKGCIPVFHPDFAAFCDDYAKPLAALKYDPYLLGYFSDNELPMPSLENYLALNPKDAQMGSSYEAARTWLDARKGRRARRADITDADRTAWTEYVFDRYFALTTQATRKYDPHHLCLGSRLVGRTAGSPAALRAAGRYLDVVAINFYGVWSPRPAAVARWTEWSGRPVLISEFYAKGMDSGLANTSGAGWVVPTQRDRGLFYQTFTLGLLEAKNVVGWHWFKFRDNDPEDRGADASNRDANKGIVTTNFVPYAPLLEQMRALNENVYAVTDLFDGAVTVGKP